MGGRRTLTAAVLAAVLLLCAGCTPVPEAGPLRVTGLTDAAHPVWQLDVALVGEPIVRDGVVASYVRGGRTGLAVRAWSLADGHELWRHDALVGKAPAGVPLSLEVVTTAGSPAVLFLAPSPVWSPSALTVAELTTGAFRTVRHPAVQATSRLRACGADVCFGGWAYDTQHLRQPPRSLRLDVASGRIRFDSAGAPPDGFAIGDRLFAVPRSGAQQLVSTGRGTTWRRPYADVFGVGSTTGGGWDWQRIGPVLVGVGGREGVRRDHRYTTDFDDTTTVGLDPGSGATRWHLRGVQPCPGTQIGTSTSGLVVELCRIRGRTSAAEGATVADVVYRDVRMTRLGVDVRDGSIVWTRAVPDTATAILPTEPTPAWPGRLHALRERGRILLLDRVTGRAAPAPDGAILLCRAQREPVTVDGQEANAGASLDPCAGRGVSRAALQRSAIGRDGWWVVPGRRTLSAYRLGR